MAAKKAKKAVKKVAKKRKPNAAFMAPKQPDDALAAVIGDKPVPRTEIVKKIWIYIKKNGLQGKVNKREIKADAKLRPLFGKDVVTMFDLAKIINKHVK
jgi:upstream activation factor subunit UAF30